MAKPWEKYQDAKPWDKYSSEPDKTMLQKVKESALGALETVGKGLDYAGGVARTTGAAALVPNVGMQDVKNALQANPLSGNEILKRAGVPQGGSLSDVIPSMYSPTGEEWTKFQKGGPVDPTARGAGGLALEMATDPLAIASLGTSKAARLAQLAGKELSPAQKLTQVATRPIGYGLEEAGKARYKSALRGVDESLKAAGKPPISQVFIQKGMPVGNMQTLRDKAGLFAKQAGETMSNIETQAAGKGATVNMLPAMNDAMELASELRKSPHPDARNAGHRLDEITSAYLEKGELVPVDQARKWSTEANQLASDVAFNPMTSSNVPFSKEANREIGQGLKKEVYSSIEGVSPEMSDAYKLANQQYSSLASKPARQELKNASKVERKKNAVTLVDAALGAGGLSQGLEHPAILGALAGKKGVEFLNTARGRTLTGRGLYEAGKLDPLLRRRSAWESLLGEENGK